MFHGSIVALVTPFTKEGEVDVKALQELIEWHIEEGSDGIVLCGTTGEGPTLSDQEQALIFKTAYDVGHGRIPLIGATGTYDTRKSVQRTQKAQEIGLDGALVIVPYYNRPTPEGCYLHYQHIAQVGLPLIVYHHPGRTGVTLSAFDMAKILAIKGVIGLKESSGSTHLVKELLSLTETLIFSGDDDLTLSMMKIGAKGVISVMANVIAKEWKEFVKILEEKDFNKGQILHERYRPLCEALFQEVNPQGIKYATSLLGKCLPSLRLPLLEPGLETQIKIKEEMLKIKGQVESATLQVEIPIL